MLYGEIDYIQEGRSADRFRRNFRGTPWVKVPRVYWRYCSPQVLTLQYLPGIKVTAAAEIAAAGLDGATIARYSTESLLMQLLRHGFFHADPHPGNIAVDAEGGGRLIYYVSRRSMAWLLGVMWMLRAWGDAPGWPAACPAIAQRASGVIACAGLWNDGTFLGF